MQQRKTYSEEFKRAAVGLTRLPGANVSQSARDLGIRDQAFRLNIQPSVEMGVNPPVHAGASSGTGNPGQVKPRTICAVHRRAPREREQDSCEHR